jgi:hypothetical protein
VETYTTFSHPPPMQKPLQPHSHRVDEKRGIDVHQYALIK